MKGTTTFFANFCKQCAILPEMAKETDIEFPSKLQRPICWCWQLAQKFPEKSIIYQKHRKETTHYPQRPMGFMSQSREMPW